eukprot:35143-Hanusia_phi.AAC.1
MQRYGWPTRQTVPHDSCPGLLSLLRQFESSRTSQAIGNYRVQFQSHLQVQLVFHPLNFARGRGPSVTESNSRVQASGSARGARPPGAAGNVCPPGRARRSEANIVDSDSSSERLNDTPRRTESSKV